MDGHEAARDMLPEIPVSDGELMIGDSPKPGTFWSGMIDDVRICSRVVKP